MGQYVTRRDPKTGKNRVYYKADSGKLYKDYLAATTAFPFTETTVGEDIQRLTRATGRALGDLGTAITGGLQDFQRGLEQAPNPYAPVSPQPSLNPLQRAKVGQPLILGGKLGYKAADGTFQLRGDMESEDIPVYNKETGYVYDNKAPLVSPTPIVRGLTPTGEVDRTQSDEYKSMRAQYDKARKELPAAEARDKGLELWAQANPVLAQKLQEQAYLAPLEKGPDGMRTATYNPLMQSTFGYQRGQAPGQFQPNYEGEELIQAYGQSQNPDPLVQQEMQQEKTAEQAAQATTAGMSARDKADDLINRFTGTTPSPFPTKRVF